MIQASSAWTKSAFANPLVSRTVIFAKEHHVHVSIPSSEQITVITKTIRFKANALSRIMDTANGGILKYGGAHRIFGGHSVADLSMWLKHGAQYAKELAKDSLTNSGLPLPGIETAVAKAKICTLSFAKKWGCMNIGDMAAGTVGVVDTGIALKRIVRSDGKTTNAKSRALKGALKIGIAVSHGNAVLAAAGLTDLAIAATSELSRLACDGFDSSWSPLPESFGF
ncbi:MAG: hypothetical protein EOP05_01335 [Proteobacteria bacterium]|nr:MAG: hypothetical protein EOP05_01335 [Pseudomonadota bacterium]